MKKEEVLQDFLIENDDWLQYLWGSRASFYKSYSNKTKKLFDIETRSSNELLKYTNISQLPQDILTKLLLSFDKERDIQEEKINNKIEKETNRKSKKFNILKENVKNASNKCKKIHFKPDNELKSLLNNCFGWVRWTYNEAVTIINEWFNDKDPNKKELSLTDLRNQVISKNSNIPYTEYGEYFGLNNDNEECNYNIREPAVSQAFIAHNNILSLLEKRKKKEQKLFEPKLKYRKKKRMNIETFTFCYKYINQVRGVYFKIFSRIKECLIKDIYSLFPINHDFTISRTNTGKYYVCIPYHEPRVNLSKNKGDINIVAIDPGARTPFTCYDPFNCKVAKISEHKVKLLAKLAKKRERIINKRNAVNIFKGIYHPDKSSLEKYVLRKFRKKVRRMTKAAFKVQEKINNLRKEFHYLTIKYLIENYDVILLPKFDVKNMIKKEGRKISKQTVKNMCLWSHYSFRMRLIEKANEYRRLVIFVDESFTTKTCGYCGFLNDVGPKEVFTCEKCRSELDRDVNASRNIFIKYLAKISGLLQASVPV